MEVSSEILIEKLEKLGLDGYQISCRRGMLSSTKAIYMRKSKIYIFRMEDKFIFKKERGYDKSEFSEEYKNYIWLIEDTIS